MEQKYAELEQKTASILKEIKTLKLSIATKEKKLLKGLNSPIHTKGKDIET